MYIIILNVPFFVNNFLFFRHAVMLACWKEDPQKRPTFKSLQKILEKIEKQQMV